MEVYYNEIEPSAIIWLKAAIQAGCLPNGDIDTRSIEDVKPNDLMGYDRCHFFAGIGGWELALQIADYEQQGTLWTGSCPCQSFSTAGKGAGFDDPRHLWPAWFWLIQQCKPDTIYGEQVAAAIGKGWLDLVANDLESESYATTAAVLPACSVGAPHKRDRLWFVAHSESERSSRASGASSQTPWRPTGHNGVQFGGAEESGTLGNPKHNGQSATTLGGSEGQAIQHDTQGQDSPSKLTRASDSSHVAYGSITGLERHGRHEQQHDTQGWKEQVRHFWSNNVQFIDCPDGKARPVKSGIRLLVNGIPAKLRKAALHGYGNAIVPQVAAEFIIATQ